MHLPTILKKYLNKVGVGDFTELDPEERATYDAWRETLEAEVTVENLTTFITAQLANLSVELQEAVEQGHDRKAILITARLKNYNDLMGVITAPDRNRESLAAFIDNLIQTLP